MDKKIEILKKKKRNEKLILEGAEGNNLKNVNLKIPLATLITGVSGSGNLV